MRRVVLPLIVLAMLLTLSAVIVLEHSREHQRIDRVANELRATCDFDSTSARHDSLLKMAIYEEALSPEALLRFRAEVQRIDPEYIAALFCALASAPTGIQTPSGYDMNYRESTRNWQELIKPAGRKVQQPLPLTTLDISQPK